MVSGWTLQNNKVEDRWEKNTQSAAEKGEKKLENIEERLKYLENRERWQSKCTFYHSLRRRAYERHLKTEWLRIF